MGAESGSSKPIDVKKPTRKRYDSIGTPDSPFRIMLMNLAKQASGITNKQTVITTDKTGS